MTIKILPSYKQDGVGKLFLVPDGFSMDSTLSAVLYESDKNPLRNGEISVPKIFYFLLPIARNFFKTYRFSFEKTLSDVEQCLRI